MQPSTPFHLIRDAPIFFPIAPEDSISPPQVMSHTLFENLSDRNPPSSLDQDARELAQFLPHDFSISLSDSSTIGNLIDSSPLQPLSPTQLADFEAHVQEFNRRKFSTLQSLLETEFRKLEIDLL